MSFQHLKEEVAQLSFAERQELSLFLGSIETDAELDELVSRRMHAMDAGKSMSLDDFKALSAKQEQDGK